MRKGSEKRKEKRRNIGALSLRTLFGSKGSGGGTKSNQTASVLWESVVVGDNFLRQSTSITSVPSPPAKGKNI
jgi:hypothetical protein